MKNYKIAHEAKDHFVLHDSNDNRQFKVAKKALSEKSYQQVKALPRLAAEGGEVTPMAVQESPLMSNPFDVYSQPAQPNQSYSEQDIANGVGAGAPPSGSTQVSTLAAPVDQASPNASAVQQGIQDSPPADDSATPSSAQAPGMRQAGNPFAAGNALQAQGIKEGVQAKTDLGTQTAKIYGDLAANQAKQDADFKVAHDAANAQTENLYNEILNKKIDPNQFWANKSTPNKIGTAIAIMFGGLGGGLSGKGGNAALDVVNKQIENDINAQKENLGNQRSLLSVNLQKTKDLESAYALTRSQLLAAAGAQVSQASAQAMGPEAKAMGDQLLGQLKNQASLQNAQFAGMQAKQQIASGQGNVNPEMLDKETRSRLVTLPNGKQTLAATDKDAEDIKGTLQGAEEFQDIINKMRQLRADNSGGTFFNGKESVTAKALQARALTTINKLAGLSRLSEPEIEQFKNQVPGVLDKTTTDANVNARLDALQDQVNSAVHSAISQRTEAPRRPSLTPTRK
jgi:hypothetical protein